jgi:hypothetical protein
MELEKNNLATVAVFPAGIHREPRVLAAERPVSDPAREMGIPPDVLLKWTIMAERAEATASSVRMRLAPAVRVHELERENEDLRRLVEKQSRTLGLLRRQGFV